MEISVRDTQSVSSPLVGSCVSFKHGKKQLFVFLYFDNVVSLVYKVPGSYTVFKPTDKSLSSADRDWINKTVLKQFPTAVVKTVAYSRLKSMLFKGV